MEQIKEFIMSLDPKVLYIIAGILIIMFIITTGLDGCVKQG